MVKNPPANVGDVRDLGSIPGSGRSPGGGHGNPLQYFSWRIPWTEEGAWQAREVHIKTILRYHLIPVKKSIIKKTKNDR